MYFKRYENLLEKRRDNLIFEELLFLISGYMVKSFSSVGYNK